MINEMNNGGSLSGKSGINYDDDLFDKYLTFRVGDQFYGLSITNVIEIVQVMPITPMPELPYYARGVINMRGRVIPVIDVSLRFGMPEKEYSARTCFIIVDIVGHHVGFVVDEVDEVLDIPNDGIAPPPSFQDGGGNRFIVGIAKMEQHMVMLLDSSLLFSDSDMALLQM